MKDEIVVEYYSAEKARRLGMSFMRQHGEKKPSKYKNKKQTIDGVPYHSIAEGDFSGRLKMMKLARKIKDFERQVKVDLFAWCPISGRKKLGIYMLVDFYVTLNCGTKEFWEFKGFKTKDWKIKKSIFKVNYPNIAYVVWDGNYKAGFGIIDGNSKWKP